MSYLRYLCLLAYSGVQHILCFVCLRLVSFVPNVVSFSGLSILDCHFSIATSRLPLRFSLAFIQTISNTKLLIS